MRYRSGIRLLGAAGLLLAAVTSGADAAGQSPAKDWLDSIEERLIAISGYPFQVFMDGNGETVPDPDSPPAVFYAPLSVIWLLDDAADDGLSASAWTVRTGRVLREDTPDGGAIRIEWNDGEEFELLWPEPLPEIRAGPERHELAIRHDRLLASELARPVAGLPAGSRFDTDGVVRPHSGQGDETNVTFWRSEGEALLLHHADGSLETVIIDDLLAAIQPATDR